ncbi:MAG: hypothetical protein FJ214_02470 [Ignavibacteria bacterium]|nr:hypothetical protein [Ignavibacteria bacterium]
MKSGQLFWGFLLVTLGALFLLTKYDVIYSDFSFIWDIWPLIFVLWGGLVIFKNSLVKPILSSTMGVFLGVMLFGFFVNVFSNLNFHFDKDELNVTNSFYEEINDSVKYVDFEFNSGGGRFEITEPTDKLISGNAYGSLADYDLYTKTDGEEATVDLSFSKNHVNIFDGKFRNYVEFGLNKNPIWDLNFNFGAAKAIFDLTPYKVRRLNLNTGAANVTLKLGDKFDSTFVSVDMGVAKLKIEIPENVGCQVKGDMVLMSRSFKGMNKIKKNYYESPDFENASKKIFIRIDGGVSSIKVTTY